MLASLYLKFGLTDEGVEVPVAMLEVGEEVQDVGAAHMKMKSTGLPLPSN